MISAIILSWKRPKNVFRIINTLKNYKLVNEIIVFNNNSEITFPNTHNDKLTIINSSRDLGLYTRFTSAALANNDCILHHDDDLIVPENTINKLYEHWIKEPNVCHSLHGRVVSDSYNVINKYGDVQIALTRCNLVSRNICISALSYIHEFNELKCEPQGNGEDIILSIYAMYNAKKLNKAYKYDLINLPGHAEGKEGEETLSIHKRWPGHIAHRTKVLKKCIDLFGFKDWSNIK